MESLENIPEHFIDTENRASPLQLHSVIVAIKQLNLDQLRILVDDMSNTHSQNFGHHMSRAEVSKLTANPAAASAIKEYFSTTDGFEVLHSSTQHHVIGS